MVLSLPGPCDNFRALLAPKSRGAVPLAVMAGVVGLGLCALIAMRGHISLLPADVVIARAFGGTRILGAVAVIGRGRGECGCAECEGRCGERD